MATHNVEDRTGGLDGSIRLAEEQSRPEVNFINSFRVRPHLLTDATRTRGMGSRTHLELSC